MTWHESVTDSPANVAMRRLGEDDWIEWRRLRLAALAEAPYAFSSTLASWSGEWDSERRWRARLRDVPFNLVADLGGQPVGMVSCTSAATGSVELISMWVASPARGRGVGDALMRAVLDHAVRQGVERVGLAVREANHHAIALYDRHGFVDTGPMEIESVGAEPERRMVRVIKTGIQFDSRSEHGPRG